MSLPGFVPGLPGIRSPYTATQKIVFRQGDWTSDLAGGKIIDGTKAADPTNTGDANVLQPGCITGKITSGGLYGTSIIDLTQGALTATATSLTLTVAGATELVRRQGTSGTFTLTGPPAASGVVRSLTMTYSSVVTSTGVVTLTSSASVNEVQTLGFTNSPSGTFQLGFVDPTGVKVWTGPITYSGTAATLVSNLNTAMDTALGSTKVVASGSAVTAIALTFSGTSYVGLPQTLVEVDMGGLSAGNVSVTRTTAGVSGAFVAGSFVGPTDGSQNPLSFIPDGYGVIVTDPFGSTRISVSYPWFPIAGVIDPAKLVNYPADSSLRTWLKNQLSNALGGKFVFSDTF